MRTKVFLFLSIVIPFRSSSKQLDCAKIVQRCPANEKEWRLKSNQFNCATDEGYVCMRDSYGYLYESCMASFTIPANSGNCPIIYACRRQKLYLGLVSAYYRCPEKTKGCPPSNHSQYRIQQLYKYPSCIESNLTVKKRENSTNLAYGVQTTTTIKTDKNYKQETKFELLYVIIFAWIVIIIGCSIGCIIRAKRTYRDNVQGHYIDIQLTDTEEDSLRDFKDWILEINKSEAERVSVVQLDEDKRTELDKIYVPVSIVDSKVENSGTDSITTLDEIFHVHNESHNEKEARFVFMFGDAGYGKTVLCQRIAKSWCDVLSRISGTVQLNALEERLSKFDFLFFVSMRDIQSSDVSLVKLIQSAYSCYRALPERLSRIERILVEGKHRCLVLLDGLDEWKLDREMRKKLDDNGIPNYRNIPNCTLMITMRFWKSIEVKHLFRKEFDREVRLNGFSDDSIESLMTNILCKRFNLDKDSEIVINEKKEMMEFVKYSDLQSLIRIPMLAIIFILTWNKEKSNSNECEKIKREHSLTMLYLSFFDTLIKRRRIKDDNLASAPADADPIARGILEKYSSLSRCVSDFSGLGKMVFGSLSSENRDLQFNEGNLIRLLGEETFDLLLKIGIVSKARSTHVSFLHKTFQEFFVALYLWQNTDDLKLFFVQFIPQIENVLKFSTLLSFLCGLSPAQGCEISKHIRQLSSADKEISRFREYFASESYRKVFWLYGLQLKCYREFNVSKSFKSDSTSAPDPKFTFSDIILHGRDSDRQTIRETANVLLHHADDIESLQMKLIPNDPNDGITDEELKEFLDVSKSIQSLNIDGYVNRRSRLFKVFSEKVTDLTTLGLHNVAFKGDILKQILSKCTNIKALSIFHIRSEHDLEIPFSLQFPSGQTKPGRRTGNEPQSTMITSSEKENSGLHMCEILKILPTYEELSTLHMSYMDNRKDRDTYLDILPNIKTLRHVGYQGSAKNETPDAEYDMRVIKEIRNIKELEKIFLCQIVFNAEALDFKALSKLVEMQLQDIDLSKMTWQMFECSIWNLPKRENLERIIFTDTSVENEIITKLQSMSQSLNIVKDESEY